jgi:hypothetical protein
MQHRRIKSKSLGQEKDASQKVAPIDRNRDSIFNCKRVSFPDLLKLDQDESAHEEANPAWCRPQRRVACSGSGFASLVAGKDAILVAR